MQLFGQAVEASMGPRPFSRGNWIGMDRVGVDWQASMGPRPFSRGNAPKQRQTWKSGRVASMGPRPFSRGNISSIGNRISVCTRFNGATAFQPWKFARRQGKVEERFDASMGPRPFSRGNAVAFRPAGCGRPRASMGPRPFSRGNVPLCTGDAEFLLSFNGATAFQPWKSPPKIGSPPRTTQLQWGHGLSAVEISPSVRTWPR